MPELLALVKEQRAITSVRERENDAICPWVFRRDGEQTRDFYRAWRDACDRAKVDVMFHDLRRSAIRQMELAGVPRSTAMRLRGHLTKSTYTRYAISAQADLSEAGVSKIAALRARQSAKTG